MKHYSHISEILKRLQDMEKHSRSIIKTKFKCFCSYSLVFKEKEAFKKVKNRPDNIVYLMLKVVYITLKYTFVFFVKYIDFCFQDKKVRL